LATQVAAAATPAHVAPAREPPKRRPTPLRADLLCGVAFCALAALYSVANPPWEASDELGHFDYVVHILTTWTLPVQSVQSPNLAHHPPLYYLFAAAFAWPADLSDPTFAPRFNPGFIWAGNGGHDPNVAIHTTAQTFPYTRHALALHLARLGSVLLGASTVVLLSATGRVAFPRVPAVGLLAVALIALDPEFLFVNGAVSNDPLIALAGTATFLAVLHAVRAAGQLGRWVAVGATLGVAMLAKSSAVALLGAVGIVLLIVAVERRSVAWLARAAACVAAPFVLLAGPWLVRNQLLLRRPARLRRLPPRLVA
jgi:4-amino-4-deoxy-L-arabinose transferase-like glycosyltransferase